MSFFVVFSVSFCVCILLVSFTSAFSGTSVFLVVSGTVQTGSVFPSFETSTVSCTIADTASLVVSEVKDSVSVSSISHIPEDVTTLLSSVYTILAASSLALLFFTTIAVPAAEPVTTPAIAIPAAIF